MTDATMIKVSAAILAVIAASVGWDVVADLSAGADLAHVVFEVVAVVAALLGVGLLAQRMLAARQEAAHWRSQAEQLLEELGSGVEQQFAAWELTAAEQEVARLLLKGLAFKEIAAVRDTSERTCRDQARAVYKKAGLAGRAELAAWFLEELIP